ncbi:XRE family transcriptional regulator [Sphingomonas gei]|uniref:XRE family transcriptional regulator n=1 Tax=Sphingomonas gei TaxID=1395960 RepID=A0A4S1XFL9_9SPHN|nr:helix-turn-helix transcriptional regulator [Sphingomonas gei]TGX54778.1 XRE family transcriptional regulator [Sphingomonas gei]
MDLRKRVGNLVALHRRRRGLTQQALADMIEMSPDMISRIETGGTGLRFPTIEKLAEALEVDPAELFIVDPAPGRDMRRPLIELTVRLSGLSDSDLAWVSELLTSALKGRR